MLQNYKTVNECLRLIQQRKRQGIELRFLETVLIQIKILVLDDTVVDATLGEPSMKCNVVFQQLLNQVRKCDESLDPDIVAETEKLSAEIVRLLRTWTMPLSSCQPAQNF